MTRPDSVVFQQIEAAHYTESKAFKAYCKDVLAFLRTCSEPATIRYIHDQLGRDRIHMTLDVLEWMHPLIDTKEYGAVTKYFLNETQKPKRQPRGNSSGWRTFVDAEQREAKKLQESRTVWAIRW